MYVLCTVRTYVVIDSVTSFGLEFPCGFDVSQLNEYDSYTLSLSSVKFFYSICTMTNMCSTDIYHSLCSYCASGSSHTVHVEFLAVEEGLHEVQYSN